MTDRHRPRRRRSRRRSPRTMTAAAVAAIAERSSTSAVASFSRLSPSSTVTMRGVTPTRFTIDVATASVGLTIAPRAMPAARLRPGTIHVKSSPSATELTTTSDDRQPADGAELAAELHRRHRHRRRVEQRRQHAGDDPLGIDLDVGHERQEAHEDADDDEQQRGGEPQLRADRGRRGDAEEPEHGDDQELHRHHLPDAPAASLAQHAGGGATTAAVSGRGSRGIPATPPDRAIARTRGARARTRRAASCPSRAAARRTRRGSAPRRRRARS